MSEQPDVGHLGQLSELAELTGLTQAPGLAAGSADPAVGLRAVRALQRL